MYAFFQDFEADVLPHPSNETCAERIDEPLSDPRSERTRMVLECILEGILISRETGEVRYTEDLPLLAALCSSEQLWRFVARKRQHSELWKAIEEIMRHPYKGSVVMVAETIKKKRNVLECVEGLLRVPHTYEAMMEMGFLPLLAEEMCDGLQDLGDQVSQFSTLTSRLTIRQHRADIWKNRRMAAQCMYRLLRVTSGMLSPLEAPEYVQMFVRTREQMLEKAVGKQKVTNKVIARVLEQSREVIEGDLSKFTEALAQKVLGADVGRKSVVAKSMSMQGGLTSECEMIQPTSCRRSASRWAKRSTRFAWRRASTSRTA